MGCVSWTGVWCRQFFMCSQADVAAIISGLLFLGSMHDDDFLQSAAGQRRIPVFFGHGGADRVFPVSKQEAFFRTLRRSVPDYPARFVRFETGTHGTPIRMIDWRDALNWMLSIES